MRLRRDCSPSVPAYPGRRRDHDSASTPGGRAGQSHKIGHLPDAPKAGARLGATVRAFCVQRRAAMKLRTARLTTIAIAVAALIAPLATSPAAADTTDPPDDPIGSLSIDIVADPPLQL